MKLTELYNDFFKSEKIGGLILVFVTLLSLVLANSSLQDRLRQFLALLIWEGTR